MNLQIIREIRRLFLILMGMLPCTATLASDYLRDVKPILKRKCYACHAALKQESNLRLDTVPLIRKGGDSGSAIDLDDYQKSLIWSRVNSKDEVDRMPPEGEPLTPNELSHLRNWLSKGAKGPANEKPMADPKRHWSFQPLNSVSPPHIQTTQHSIDAFIDEKLVAAGLSRSPRADPITLVRRMFLDLHGLPPTPEAIEKWVPVVHSEEGRRQLIDVLLASPRYGERMALFWLDLVRYADTHGFEVNTPRPNAWPYRDYVIQSFNSDKPYDQFIQEQIVGDALNADAATGFLVTAAVLLPGQIGKDEASKRLARQDELNEIIVGTGASFLGLTIGCARCHDHKFEPLTQDDYYSFQAFFAGVEYGDRPIMDEASQQRRKLARQLEPQIERLRQELLSVQPKVFAGRTVIIDDEDESRTSILKKKNGHGANPSGIKRGYREDPGSANRTANISRGRYTWWTNRPGEDVFTWNPNVEGQFRIWISWGTHGSGVHTRDARYVLDRDGDLKTTTDQKEITRADQYYFAGQSAGTSEKRPLWSGLHLAGVHQLEASTRLILRGGKTGTGITADAIVLQEVVSEANTNPLLPRLRSPVNPTLNIETFDAVAARFVRFEVLATMDDNRHQPCIDELEVFGASDSGKNIANAEYATTATSSGNYNAPNRHRLEYVNDGNYGNSKSWISNQHGSGWVQLEFLKAEQIDRIQWSRDRLEKFKDRLAVAYRIDVSLNGKDWTRVAGSDDRLPYESPFDRSVELAQISSARDHTHLGESLERLKQLETQKAVLEKTQLAYAGTFKKPEAIFLLNRGDPEQPTQKKSPQIPGMFGKVSLSDRSTDIERRQHLANWIANPQNPLTARVMVNRLWQMHFGQGLVNTPNDFGLNGSRPSHPKLLDWLASEFINNGWSIKRLHKTILTSESYSQDSKVRKEGQQKDADNRLLWRFTSRRLEAEAIRDCMLQVSGELNLKMNGPGFDFFKSRGGLNGFPPVEEFGPEQMRRMIYAHKVRMESVPIFGAFDCPDAGQSTPVRSQSTTAIQALNLFNSDFVYDRAKAIAKRVEDQVGNNPDHQLESLFQLMLGRKPSPKEASVSVPAIREHGLTSVARALLNTNEFLFMP